MRKDLGMLIDYVRTEVGFLGDLDPDTNLLDAYILDSFSIVQLAVFIQERFGVELEAEDFSRANLATLSSIVALIDKRRIAAGSGRWRKR